MDKKSETTILMPNFNHSHFLRESIYNIFNQDKQPLELIIIDDASTDNSVSVIEELKRDNKKIKLIKEKKNKGPNASLNIGLNEAQGKYLAFCSADDLVFPSFLKDGEDLLQSYPEAGICTSNPSFFKEMKPYQFTTMKLLKNKNPAYIAPERIPQLFLHSSLWIPSHASLFRKECVKQCGGFKEALNHLSDWYLNIQIAIRYGIVHHPGSFGGFRISRQSYGAMLQRDHKRKVETYIALFRILSQETKSFVTTFRNSGCLGVLPANMLLFLLKNPRLWGFFPQATYRKMSNLYRKVVCLP